MRNVGAGDRRRLSTGSDVGTITAYQCDLLERRALLRPFPSVHRVDGHETGVKFANGEYTLGVLEGERLEQHRVDKREDGSVSADANRERKDRDSGETGILS